MLKVFTPHPVPEVPAVPAVECPASNEPVPARMKLQGPGVKSDKAEMISLPEVFSASPPGRLAAGLACVNGAAGAVLMRPVPPGHDNLARPAVSFPASIVLCHDVLHRASTSNRASLKACSLEAA